MAKYTNLDFFYDRKRFADETKERAEDYERKGNYVDAKRYYFEAAKKYKDAAEYARDFGHGVYEVHYSFFDKEEDMMIEYEYCMMQVKAMIQLQIGRTL